MATSQKRQFTGIFQNVSSASASLTPGTLTTDTSEAVTIAVPGALMGDIVFVSLGGGIAQTALIQVTGEVLAANVVSVVFSNTTAGPLTPAAGVYTVVACTLDPVMSI
jgi:hypothetical protein